MIIQTSDPKSIQSLVDSINLIRRDHPTADRWEFAKDWSRDNGAMLVFYDLHGNRVAEIRESVEGR